MRKKKRSIRFGKNGFKDWDLSLAAVSEALECPLPLTALQTPRAEGCALGWHFEVTPFGLIWKQQKRSEPKFPLGNQE